MSESPETPPDPKPRVNKEYEDPHYHDEDDVPVEDGLPQVTRAPAPKAPPSPPLPKPRRRYYED